ncbi:hypothetical protein FRC03_006084 [Tulasnella sp. 419]|nr:hypothetical protein FRC03_006084 [Tulasnella sp. 419]
MADLPHSAGDPNHHQQHHEGFGIDLSSFDIAELMNMQQQQASSGNREMYGDRAIFSGQQPNQYQLQTSPIINAEALKQQLQQQLQQQMRLQQLQQLQNQILQQQIELISGQASIPKEVLMHGLLTPTSSSELRPIVHPSFPPPMSLQQQYNQDPHGMMNSLVSPAMTPINVNTNLSNSTPFHSSSHMTPVDMFSPLTSPALEPSIGATNPHHNVPYSQQSYASSRSSVASVSASPSHQELSLGSDLSSHSQPSPSIPPRKSSKRTLADDQGSTSRKRQSPIIKPSIGSSGPPGNSKRTPGRTARRQDSLSASDLQMALSTPSSGDIDISMPPPAPPAPPLPPMTLTVKASSRSPSSASPNMEPITPASIMNLGLLAKMPAGLVPQQQSEQNSASSFAQQQQSQYGDTNMAFSGQFQQPNQQQQFQNSQQLANMINQTLANQDTQMHQQATTIDPKLTRTPLLSATDGGVASGSEGGRSNTHTPTPASTGTSKKPKTLAISTGNAKGQTSVPNTPSLRADATGRGRSNTTGTRSQPKAILPSGMSIEAASQLKSNMSSASSGPPSASSLTGGQSEAPPEFKKSTHKQAEQKRRDSLKQGFDELRILLPPISIDPDSDEPRLPGSQPPRGPPRNVIPGTEDHPNRSVSKMALLKCSNEYIGRLVKRVGRRDEEIGRLREEIRVLRSIAGVGEDVKGFVIAQLNELDGNEKDQLGVPRMWADLEKDLDEIEREELEAKGRTAIKVSDPAVAVKPKSSKISSPRDMDEDD